MDYQDYDLRMDDLFSIRFPSEERRVTWRDVRDVRFGMTVYHCTAPRVLMIGRDVKISLWSRLICRLRYGIEVKRQR